MQQKEKYDEINTFRAMSARRLDWFQATLVEEGIILQRQHGTDFAAAFLKGHKIGTDVATRVLTHPEERRHYSMQ